MSGATLERPGLRLLLEAAVRKPRPFDTLLIEDASRLSRKRADVLNLCERLSFAGVKIHFISQGIDSGDEKFQLLLLARGMIDQIFLADTAKRVRRGLEGLIRRGLHTGGRCTDTAVAKTTTEHVLRSTSRKLSSYVEFFISTQTARASRRSRRNSTQTAWCRRNRSEHASPALGARLRSE
jgi:DNA invertase Pin-like site-specific DNA recombinase